MITETKRGPGGTEFIKRCEIADPEVADSPSSPLKASGLATFHAPVSPALIQDDGPETRSEGAKPAPTTSSQGPSKRHQFWADTCRDPGEQRSGSKVAGELRRKYGWRFCAPTPEQVQFVLDSLDAALPTWETGRPDLFFDKLQAHFPDLQKYR